MTEPALTREVVIGALEEFKRNSRRYPLFDFWPREQYMGEKLKIFGRRKEPRVGEFTTADGPMHSIAPGAIFELEVEPLYHRPSRDLLASEMALFAAWDEIRQTAGPATDAIEAEVQKKIAEIAGDLFLDQSETMHDALAQALQGTGSYVIDGVATPVDYGLTPLTQPSVTWENASATIIKDVWQMKQEFIENAGVPADTIFYNPKDWAEYFVGNTDFLNYVKANEGLAAMFAGQAPSDAWIGENLAFVDPIWGMLWVPIEGPHLNISGSSVDRWDHKLLTVAALRGEDGGEVLEHAMVRDQYTPRPEPEVEIWDGKDPKVTHVRRADNVAAAIKDRTRVQTWRVEAA